MSQFALWSGLSKNDAKTELFSLGQNQQEASNLSGFGFSFGSLPIRYVGLPLMHRNLCISDYNPLLNRLLSKFSSWTTRALSYAGRLQLLSSVIYSLVNFWMSAFLLLKGCIKKIQSLCSCFLWSGDVTKSAFVKVSWDHSCRPKDEGGLGLRNLNLWNKTLSLRLVWLLFADSGSLWVAWTKRYRLQVQSFWAHDDTKQSSATWKSLLSLRPLASRFIRCEVGDGTKASFWFDQWTPLGPLIDLCGISGPS